MSTVKYGGGGNSMGLFFGLISVEVNAIVYKDLSATFTRPTLWQQFGKAPSCSHTTLPMCTKEGP